MAAADRPQDGSLSSCRVLVVEDEFLLADEITRALQRCGAQVVGPTGDLAMALRLTTEEAIDCAILDINLRGDNAIEIARELNRRNIPYVFATGYTPDYLPEDQRGATLFEKPFEAEQLLRTIKSLCHSRAH